MAKTVAVLGASGFLGSMVFEHLDKRSSFAATPFAGSTGGASALAHQGRILAPIDMLDYPALESALAGFDYVLNCARGDNAVLEKGFDNLLAAAKKCRIEKLVHISSVAIYGDPPHPDSATEDAPLTDAEQGYGAVKRDQDIKLQKAARNGLGAIILCPPNIVGRYSEYVLDIIESIERGRFRLVNNGDTAVNVIDVDALAAVVERAIASPIDDGRRLFVNHAEPVTWRGLCDALTPVLRSGGDMIPSIDAAVLQNAGTPSAADSASPNHSALRHLISEDVRDALKTHPTWFAVEQAGKRLVRTFGGRAETYMRFVANGPIQVDTQTVPDAFDRALVAQQLRGVRHRPDQCLAELDMTLPVDFQASMDRFRAWYARYFEIESHAWQLLANRAG